jgi:hypothetical protein
MDDRRKVKLRKPPGGRRKGVLHINPGVPRTSSKRNLDGTRFLHRLQQHIAHVRGPIQEPSVKGERPRRDNRIIVRPAGAGCAEREIPVHLVVGVCEGKGAACRPPESIGHDNTPFLLSSAGGLFRMIRLPQMARSTVMDLSPDPPRQCHTLADSGQGELLEASVLPV